MKSPHKAGIRLVLALTAAASLLALEVASAAASKAPQLPSTITTTDGKTYQSVRFVSTDPEGLTIEYAPGAGGIGLARIKFARLPDNLRQQFNYSEDAANAFAQRRGEVLAEWRNHLQESEEAAATEKAEAASEQPENLTAPNGGALQPGRFQVEGTIRGAVILDTISGAAWTIDLHTTPPLPIDYTPFTSPKVFLPAQH